MSFADAWNKAGQPADEYEPAKGRHKVKITDGGAFTSRAGDDYAKVELMELEGDNAGRKFEHFMGFKNETAARINREALLAYGLQGSDEIRSIDDLEAKIQDLIGTEADVGVAYKDGYMNITVYGSRTGQSDIPSNGFGAREEADEPDQPSFAQAAGQKADDDKPIPF
jgi:hypothetical protein